MRTILCKQFNKIYASEEKIHENLLFGHFLGSYNHKAIIYFTDQAEV